MLLIGIWMSLTKNPMKPMMQKPMAVAIAIFWNSRRSGFVQRFTKRSESLANKRPGSQNLISWSISCLLAAIDLRGESDTLKMSTRLFGKEKFYENAQQKWKISLRSKTQLAKSPSIEWGSKISYFFFLLGKISTKTVAVRKWIESALTSWLQWNE